VHRIVSPSVIRGRDCVDTRNNTQEIAGPLSCAIRITCDMQSTSTVPAIIFKSVCVGMFGQGNFIADGQGSKPYCSQASF
jgi:hypothetical protein